MVGGAEIIFRHSRYVQAARAHDIISHWDLSRAIRSKFHCLVKFCRLISLRGPAGRNSQGGDVEAREKRASRRKSVGIVRWKLVNTVSPRKLCLLFLSCRSAGYHRVAPFCRVKMVFLVFPLLSGLYLHSSHFSKVIRGAKSDQRVFEKKKKRKKENEAVPLADFLFFLSFFRLNERSIDWERSSRNLKRWNWNCNFLIRSICSRSNKFSLFESEFLYE